MIDTDKYEGHTKGNWCIDDGNGVVKTDEFWIRLFEPYCSDCITEDEDTINKKLMMSAPDLLAEVKRLNELIEQVIEVWEICNHEDRNDWFYNFCRIHKEEGEEE